jgi:hypothetical protein
MALGDAEIAALAGIDDPEQRERAARLLAHEVTVASETIAEIRRGAIREMTSTSTIRAVAARLGLSHATVGAMSKAPV